jgi:hypothetical protein
LGVDSDRDATFGQAGSATASEIVKASDVAAAPQPKAQFPSKESKGLHRAKKSRNEYHLLHVLVVPN